MKLPTELERIRLSQKEKDALVTLKRRTGIGQWNVLCRWAFLLSLAERKAPKTQEIISDSNIEMGWKTFGGEYDQLFLHLLIERCLADGISTEQSSLVCQFRIHLQRGISYLSAKGKITNIRNIIQLVKLP